MKAWVILESGLGFVPSSTISLACPKCRNDAPLPFRPWPENPVIASMGLSLVFDKPGMVPPPFQMLPVRIKCGYCAEEFEQ